MHLTRLGFSVKQIAIMIIITIVATTMGSPHGSTHVQHYVNNTSKPSAFPYDGCESKHIPLDVEGVVHRQHMKRELTLISQQGAVGQRSKD
jgi:hypothetical protein